MLKQRQDSAVLALRQDAGNHKNIQAIASKGPKVTLDTLKSVGGRLNNELHKASEVATVGWNLGKTLWDIGKKVYDFARPVAQIAGRAGPLVEEVAEMAPLLLM
jgi:hypothetical protein